MSQSPCWQYVRATVAEVKRYYQIIAEYPAPTILDLDVVRADIAVRSEIGKTILP